ncbi:hypothetical protein GBAR_LOCUS8163 [Geodia barretti]|uniref:Uncharacterized protein n=1 Tax=Geodia barretti TaxID=519541 RepID=A0AA35WFR5_GEOBA|nr:hypothetical protein GBAR_LOCUS8163 [Geodia barretti]
MTQPELSEDSHSGYAGISSGCSADWPYSNIDPGITIDDLETASRGIVEANLTLLEGGRGDMVVTQTITMASPISADDLPSVDIAVYCTPLEFNSFARSYVDGVRLYTPVTYPRPPEAEGGDGKRGSTQTLALMVNDNGFITECQGANFMFVVDGRIKLPDRRNVLPGVSMHTVLELAGTLGIGVDEGLYSPSLIYGADEAFVSSTRYCMLPVATLKRIPSRAIDARPGHRKTIVGVERHGRHGLRPAGSQLAFLG